MHQGIQTLGTGGGDDPGEGKGEGGVTEAVGGDRRRWVAIGSIVIAGHFPLYPFQPLASYYRPTGVT
jgi:hypothetical protein